MVKMKLKAVKVSEERLEYSITSPEKAMNALHTMGLHEEPEEVCVLLCLNTKGVITAYYEVSRGHLNGATIHPREVFKRALISNCNAIMIAHNHPSGDPTPSQEDIRITKRLIEVGELIGIEVLDHIIVGDDACLSLRQEGKF